MGSTGRVAPTVGAGRRRALGPDPLLPAGGALAPGPDRPAARAAASRADPDRRGVLRVSVVKVAVVVGRSTSTCLLDLPQFDIT